MTGMKQQILMPHHDGDSDVNFLRLMKNIELKAKQVYNKEASINDE